jgi:hypothetical protein
MLGAANALVVVCYKLIEMLMEAQNSLSIAKNKNVLQNILTTVGILCGMTGIEHGIFETLQGNTIPDNLMINAIQPSNRFWPGGTELAFTVVPNFLWTGIFAIIFGVAVIYWAMTNLQTKYGAPVLFCLLALLFITGGGFGQVLFIPFIAIAATQINSSLPRFRKFVSIKARQFIGKYWLILVCIYSILVFTATFAAIFGYVPIIGNFGVSNFVDILVFIGIALLIVLPITLISGIAQNSVILDNQKR